MTYKKGQLMNKTTAEGKQLYFVHYSHHLKKNGQALLVCATDIDNSNTYGHYERSFFTDNKEYIEALNNHQEVVIVSSHTGEYSAIFWKDAAGIICSFNHTFGILKRPEYTNERFLEHIKTMQEENALIFIRGCND